MMLEETVKFHNDAREWKCVDVENVYQHPNVLPIYTLVSGSSEIRMTDHEIHMNRVYYPH